MKTPPIEKVLYSILISINAAEEWRFTTFNSDTFNNKLNECLDTFALCLEERPLATKYNTNEKLSVFDKVFNKAGWDGQGFRWKKHRIVVGELS